MELPQLDTLPPIAMEWYRTRLGRGLYALSAITLVTTANNDVNSQGHIIT